MAKYQGTLSAKTRRALGLQINDNGGLCFPISDIGAARRTWVGEADARRWGRITDDPGLLERLVSVVEER